MKCPRCNAEVEKGEKYCNKCGKKIKSKKPIIISIAVVLVIALITVSVSFLFFGNGSPSPDKINTLSQEELTALSNENYVSFSEGFTDVKVTDEKSAFEAVSSVSDTIGINNVEKELKISGTNSFDGETFYRMQQYYNDIPVYGKDVVLASDKNGLAISLTANSINIGQGLNGKKVDNDFDDKKAVAALEDYFDNLYSVEDKGPYYMAYDNNQIKLTHLYNVFANVDEETVNLEVSVSYSDYKVVFTNDLVRTNNEDYSYKVSDDKYYMFDEKRNIVMLNSNRGLAKTLHCDDEIHIVDSAGIIDDEMSDEEKINAYNNFLENNDEIKNDISDRFSTHVYSPIEYVTSNNNTWDKNAAKFMNCVEKSYDYYNDKFKRKGYDNENGEMFVTYNDKIDGGYNAYSTGNSLCFGYNESSSAVDLVAHEFTHSVEGSISGMIYEGESGALMEAYSDIFGELVENYANGKCDWLHNKGRNLKNPPKSKVSGITVAYPQKYKDKNWLSTTNLNNDHGGVHTNCTVISHAAYLMNNGIDGDENMKISTELLAKIWYKSLFLLHPNATFAQCADAVYNAALMTDDVTFEQRVCIRAAFEEVGLDVEAITSYTVLNGTTVYAISKDNKKYQNYHMKVCDYNSGETIDEKDIVDDKGYKLDLDTGKYIISLTDNNKGSNNTFYKTINLRNIPEKRVASYINILTDFYFDYDKPLKEKLSELIDEYGIASTETYTENTEYLNAGWANREGILSVEKADIDGDKINELIVIRLIKGNGNAGSSKIEVSAYKVISDSAENIGTYDVPYGNNTDKEDMTINAFTCKIDNELCLIIESDLTLLYTDLGDISYYLFKCDKGVFSKTLEIYNDADSMTLEWIKETCSNGEKKKTERINSSVSILDVLVDIGFPKTDNKFTVSGCPSFCNAKGAKKICTLKTERTDLSSPAIKFMKSTAEDFTGLDHSKASSSPEEPDKSEEWKDLYISELDASNIYNSAALAYINDDDIPELVLQSYSILPGTKICWIKDNKVESFDVSGMAGLSYDQKSGVVRFGQLNHGISSTAIYTFDGNSVSLLHSGNNNYPNGNECYWDNKSVSLSEYEKQIGQYNFEDHGHDFISFEEIKEVIKNY